MTIKSLVKTTMACALAATTFQAMADECTDGCYPKRWVYFGGNLLTKTVYDEYSALVPRMKALGFNGIALNTGGSGAYSQLINPSVPTGDKLALAARIQAAIKLANDNGIEAIPISAHPTIPATIQPELLEAFPTSATYATSNGRGTLVPSKAGNLLKNGGFEADPVDWAVDAFNDIDNGGVKIANIGRASARSMLIAGKPQHPSTSPYFNGSRLYQQVQLKANTAYRLSFYLKSDTFDDPTRLKILIQDVIGNRGLPMYAVSQEPLGWGITAGKPDATGNKDKFIAQVAARSPDWVPYTVQFNSGNRTNAWIYFRIDGVVAGTSNVWIDDVDLREIGISNPRLRAGVPEVEVRTSTGTLLKQPTDYEVDGEALVIKHPLYRDAASLAVKWSQSPAKIFSGAPGMACGDSLKIQKQLYDEAIAPNFGNQPVTRVEPVAKYFMYYDEIPVLNWGRLDGTCKEADAGTYLGKMVRDIQNELPGVQTLTWNDMFDPTMNGVANYYQVNQTLSKGKASEYNLDPNTIIVNWAGGGEVTTAATDTRKTSLAWFRDYRQVVALYYENVDTVDAWLGAVALESQKGALKIDGLMYTTWVQKNGYADLEAVAQKIRANPVSKNHWPQADAMRQ